MAIRTLKNPLTEEYLKFKNMVLRNGILQWKFSITSPESETVDKTYYLSHTILDRPEGKQFTGIPRIKSDHYNFAVKILKDIFDYNDLNVNCFFRINLNCTLNWGGGLAVRYHVDHDFYHKNLLIYLNKSSGPTVVLNENNNSKEFFHPQEDVIIQFKGKHAAYQPNIGERRIVLVATYI